MRIERPKQYDDHARAMAQTLNKMSVPQERGRFAQIGAAPNATLRSLDVAGLRRGLASLWPANLPSLPCSDLTPIQTRRLHRQVKIDAAKTASQRIHGDSMTHANFSHIGADLDHFSNNFMSVQLVEQHPSD